VELFAFYQIGGFDAIFAICSELIKTIEQLVKIKEENRIDSQKKELLHAYGAIKVALHLICPIISAKALFESGQTLLIATRDIKDNEPDYFEPHNFLVKLRSAALPTIRGFWDSPWLIQAPLAVSRYVVRAVLEIANAENEETKNESNADSGTMAAGLTRPSGPDEARIRILTDMGFPRSAAERALLRTHNNVNSATELLLSHPFPLPPDPVADIAEALLGTPSEPPADSSEPEIMTNDNNEELVMSDDRDIVTQPNPEPSSTENIVGPLSSAAPGKSVDEWRKSLDEAREPLRASISRQSLLLIDEHLALLFDLHVAFTKQSSHQQQAVRDLVGDIKAFSAFAYDVQEQPLANRCRLLALVFCENPGSIDQDLRNTLMDHLLALLLSSVDPEHPPRWLAAHLLVTEALFTLSDDPRAITLPKEGEPIATEAISVGPQRAEAKGIVFDFCLRLLCVNDLPADELLSVLRLFVLLTRDREMATQFVKRDGLVSLFARIRHSAVTGGSSYVATILRHIVEDVPTVQNIMQQTIKRYFTQPRPRIVDVNTYVRNCSAIALRDVNIFIETTKSLCQLEQPFSVSPQVKLQPDSTSPEKLATPVGEGPTDMQVDVPPSGSPSAPQKAVESVIHLIVGELMSAVRAVNDSPPSVSNANDQNTPSQTDPSAMRLNDVEVQQGSENAVESESVIAPVDIQDKYQYSCFLMQCLTELLFSYDSSKVVFLSYSTKKRSQPLQTREPISKFRTLTLHFLLSELVTYGTISTTSDTKHRNKGLLCSWAMNVIGALCVDTSSAQDMKDVSTDLVFVRKFVLETISRAIKDIFSGPESTDARYGRLLALADLCHRLLTVRVNPTSRKHQDDVPTHLAKIMLEKNFVAVLTTALSEVDLNYPNVRNLVAAILRPLEYLSVHVFRFYLTSADSLSRTKIAIKMSKSSGKNKEGARKDASVSEGSEDNEEILENEGREETPDLYRNSALGMYAGVRFIVPFCHSKLISGQEMDDGHYSENEDMDEEDEDQDVEMDYGEETGSEDTSASESDGEQDDLDQVTQGSGEVWDEADEEDEEDLVENEDVDDGGDDEHDEDDENEGEEAEDEEDEEGMMWEVRFFLTFFVGNQIETSSRTCKRK